jgi:hypothetical protein
MLKVWMQQVTTTTVAHVRTYATRCHDAVQMQLYACATAYALCILQARAVVSVCTLCQMFM